MPTGGQHGSSDSELGPGDSRSQVTETAALHLVTDEPYVTVRAPYVVEVETTRDDDLEFLDELL